MKKIILINKIYIEVLTKFPKDCQVWEWIQENELYIKLKKTK